MEGVKFWKKSDTIELRGKPREWGGSQENEGEARTMTFYSLTDSIPGIFPREWGGSQENDEKRFFSEPR